MPRTSLLLFTQSARLIRRSIFCVLFLSALTLSQTALAASTLSQEQYIFLNDNGTTTDTYTQSHSAATNTPITNVKKGEKLVARIQIANTGNAAATSTYRLQWENFTDAAGTWTDVSSTTQVRWELSQKAALPGRSGQVPLPTNQVGTCTTTTTYIAGLFTGGTATSSMYSLNPNKCTELAYAIETSGATLGKTYRLRLVTGSTTSQLDAYPQYPTFTIESAQTIRYSKEARGGFSATTLDSLGDLGVFRTGVAIGSDGFPVISYRDATRLKLIFAKCSNTSCSSYATSSLDDVGDFDLGSNSSIAIGRDGFPVISYYDFSNGDLKFIKCNNVSCSSVTSSSLDTATDVGWDTSIAIGSDGFPVISYYAVTGGNLKFLKCDDGSCTSVTITTLDSVGDVGWDTSTAIGIDGFPVISYYDITSDDLNFAKCNNISCSSVTISSLDTGGIVGSDSSITIGSDGFPVISYYDSTNSNLKFIKCNNVSCSSVTTSTLDTGGDIGADTSIAIGTDGFPVISYYDTTNGNLNVAKCDNISCSSYATSSLDTAGNVGRHTLLAIGSDGFPVISYYDATNGNLNFAKCNDIACKTAASSTANLATSNADLSQHLDDDAYTNVASSDNIYDSISAGTSTRLAYLFTKKNRNNSDAITATWEGQVSKATTTFLKIYNNSTGAWTTLSSNTSPTPNSDFTLTGTASTSISSYYDANNVAYFRVETGTTTASTTLKTDMIAIGSVLSQEQYIFLNDNGTTTDTYTQSHGAATNTSITSVKKGEKLITRMQIANTGIGTTTNQYRLQWENNTDAAGTWTDVGSTTQIRWELSQKAALPGRFGQVPLTTKQVGNCTTTTTFSPGLFVAGTATSSMLSVGPNKCTELAYALETSGVTLNKTYRLRLVTGSTTSQLDAYPQYPTFTIESAQSIRYSKEARGGYSTTTLDSLGDVGQYTSLAIGSDGFPVISYFDNTNSNLNFAKCNNISCSSYATSSLDSGGDVGRDASLAVGSDGFPVISYRDASNARLIFAKCNNITCTSVATSTLDTVTALSSSITIGTDGYPVISYMDNANGNLNFVKCNNVSCSSAATSSLDGAGAFIVGQYSSIAIDSEGFPVISYYDSSNGNLNFAKCSNIACSSYATSSLDTGGNVGRYTAIAIGSDGFPVISYQTAFSNLNFAKCSNISCSSVATSSLDSGGDVGRDASLAIGSDGFPVISYYDATNSNLKFAKCNNISCSSVSTSSLDQGGSLRGYTSLAIGTDGFPIISYYSTSTNLDLNLLKCYDIYCRTAASSTANLATSNADLSQYLDDDAYTNVATSDNIYDSIAAGTSTRLAYVFTKKNSNNTDPITPTWEGQVSKATSTYLEIYDNISGRWSGIATNTTPVANTDFTLTTTISTSLSNYYDGSNVVYFRVETGTTTASTTLKTDQFTASLGSVSPTLVQTHYRFREDNGTEIAATYSAAEDTALVAADRVFKGDRKRLRILVQNTGAAATTTLYLLEYASSSCSTWFAVPAQGTASWQEWTMDLSQWVPDSAVTTNSSGLTDPNANFVAGRVMLQLNQTPAITLDSATNQFTENEYGIGSTANAQANLLYCFRLTNAGSATNFTYTVQPRVTLSGGTRPQSGGSGSETGGSGGVHNSNGQGGGENSEGGGTGIIQSGGGAGGGGGDSG